ncbi:MAG: acetyltransferase [Cyclobacteriaceae bacterium]|nr:acetyltransferase [Cyclobacteriaceae bacterium]
MNVKRVVIFGIQDFAELAWYYLGKDSPYEVVGFCVNEKYLPDPPFFHELPVVPFERVSQIFPPDVHGFFAPMSPKRMNRFREEIYHQLKALGYELISYVSSKATIFNNPIGENCFILEDNTIQPFTTIGNNVVLWSGNHIGHHGRIMDHVSFTSHVVMSGHCVIEPYCFLGVNATIRDGITLAEGTFLAMHSAVTKSTSPWGVYVGSPAKIREGVSSLDMLK